MKATDIVHYFETEWLTKHPSCTFFNVDGVVIEIAHMKSVSITDAEKNSLSKFLTRYLLEHTDRFPYQIHRSFNRRISQSSPN